MLPPRIPETGRCSVCDGSGYTVFDPNRDRREYCACNLGKDLKRIDARIAAQADSHPE